MAMKYIPTNASTLKKNLAEILDAVGDGKEARIIQRVSNKEDAVILSYRTYLGLLDDLDKHLESINNFSWRLLKCNWTRGFWIIYTKCWWHKKLPIKGLDVCDQEYRVAATQSKLK